jgi:hypothetical protein
MAVESIDHPGWAEGIVVARAAAAHPNADKIQLVDVDLGDGEALQICCGRSTWPSAVPLATLARDARRLKIERRGCAASGRTAVVPGARNCFAMTTPASTSCRRVSCPAPHQGGAGIEADAYDLEIT